jgi:hypothetical protein
MQNCTRTALVGLLLVSAMVLCSSLALAQIVEVCDGAGQWRRTRAEITAASIIKPAKTSSTSRQTWLACH